MIIGILGFAGTGKSTVADILCRHGGQMIGFADELKRLTMNLFDFEPHQVWGTQAQKEAPDLRYPREHSWKWKESDGHMESGYKCVCCGANRGDPDRDPCFLTGRYALQVMGTEGGRQCWSNIWVKKAIDTAQFIEKGHRYHQRVGIETAHDWGSPMAVFADCRFVNEVEAILGVGGRVYRIKRPGFEKPRFNHASETEQLQIPDDRLQGVIDNDGTLDDLEKKVLALIQE